MMKHRPDLPLAAIGYIRVSTEMQAEGDHALERQAEIVRKFAREKGLKLLGIHEDVASAFDQYSLDRRPGLTDATRHASEQGASLVVSEPTRLFRNTEVSDRWRASTHVPVLSVRDGGLITDKQLRDAVSRGQQSAERIQAETSDGFRRARRNGKHLGSPGDKAAASKASAKVRAARSDELVTMIAHILLSDPAYRTLPHKALADLLNRRGILTGWERPWTAVGIRRHRYEAEKRIAEWADLDREDEVAHVEVSPVSDTARDESEMQKLPTFGMF